MKISKPTILPVILVPVNIAISVYFLSTKPVEVAMQPVLFTIVVVTVAAFMLARDNGLIQLKKEG